MLASEPCISSFLYDLLDRNISLEGHGARELCVPICDVLIEAARLLLSDARSLKDLRDDFLPCCRINLKLRVQRLLGHR